MFPVHAAALWRAWMESVAARPRTVLRAQDERTRRSLHVERSGVLRFPDLVRVKILTLGPERSGLILDSRARFGRWDLGVNRRRVQRWVDDLQQITGSDSARVPTKVRLSRGSTARPARRDLSI